jgi:hypothetical protein
MSEDTHPIAVTEGVKTMHRPKVYRQLAFPVSVFDRIKEVQRQHAAVSGQRMTITEVVSHIVQAHQRHESQERPPRAALLRCPR